jgi:hypothetical protein
VNLTNRQWRWVLPVMAVLAGALGWVTGPLMWAGAVICLILAIWNERVIRLVRRVA